MKNIWIIGLPLSVLFAGCQSSSKPLTGSVEDALTVSTVAPLAASYVTAEGLNRSYQSSAIAVGLPDPAFAERVTKNELIEIARRHEWKFHEPWLYMGTKNEYHFLALYPFLGFRTVYSVPSDQWPMIERFPLTSIASRWREIRIVPDGRMMRDLWILESDEPIRFIDPDHDPITFFEGGGQQIGDGNAVKPPGDERSP